MKRSGASETGASGRSSAKTVEDMITSSGSEGPVGEPAVTTGGDCKGIAARLLDSWTRSEARDSAYCVAN